MEQFLIEKKGIEYCRQYSIDPGTKEYEVAINAFLVGFTLGKSHNDVNRPDAFECGECGYNGRPINACPVCGSYE